MSTSAGRVLMIPKGDYNAAETYTMLDVVSYQGKSYVAKQTTTGNAPTNTTYWQLMIDAQGHTIKNSTTTFPNRANLVFDGFYVEDDPTNNETVVYHTDPRPLYPFATATDAELAEMIAAYYNGEITLDEVKEVWSVGDEREVTLGVAGSSGDLASSQNIHFVIYDFGGKTLASNNEECLAIIGQKEALKFMQADTTGNDYNKGWPDCTARTWCNTTYKNAIPEGFRALFKEFYNLSNGGGYRNYALEQTADYFAFPAGTEIVSPMVGIQAQYEVAGEGDQFKYFETEANRTKYQPDGTSAGYWTRSDCNGSSYSWNWLYCNGVNISQANQGNGMGASPFGVF